MPRRGVRTTVTRNRKEEGVVGRSAVGGLVVSAALVLAFVAVALSVALNS
jgi:hypothetical protein